jgi:hypothetical protein
MKRLPVFFLALLILSCWRPALQGHIATVDLVPSRQRALAQSDSEPVVTSWLTLGMSFASARASVLYGLLISDSPVLDTTHNPAGGALHRGLRVTVTDATPWETAGRDYRRWYRVREQGSSKDVWVDSADVALITVESGSLSAGFLERKIAVAGGESEYNVLVLCDGSAVSLIDSSAFVFPDAFHPSGVTQISLEDVNSDGTTKAVVRGQTIVSLQFLGASPLAWEAWLKEKDGSWGSLFRFNSSYGTDQGNSYTATRRVFSSTGAALLDTVKVTTDLLETTAQGVFHATIETFFLWNGSLYKENPDEELPKEASVIVASAELKARAQPDGEPVERLRKGNVLFVFDRGDTAENLAGQPGFWLHAKTHEGKDGWVHSSTVKLTKIDPLKINSDVFLGKPGFTPSTDQTASP